MSEVNLTIVPQAPIEIKITAPSEQTLTLVPQPTIELKQTLVDTFQGVHFDGNLLGSVTIPCKNTDAATLPKGTPVYVKGNVGSTNVIEVGKAVNDDFASMAAIGVLETTLLQNEFGHVITHGLLEDVDTSGWNVHMDVYVSNATGTIALTKPYGLTITEPPKNPATPIGPGAQPVVQRIGHVTRVNANNGSIFIHGGIAAEKSLSMVLSDLGDCYVTTTGVVTDTYVLAKAPGGGNSVWSDYAIGTLAAPPIHTHNQTQILPTPSASWDGKIMQWDDEEGAWSQWDPSTINATLANQCVDPFIKPPATARYVPCLTSTGFATWTATGVHNSLRLVPFTIGYDMVVSAMEAYVITGAVATGVELCLYGSDVTTGRPIGLPLAESPVIATQTSGVTISYTFPSNITLSKGMTYWIGARYQSISGNSASYRGLSPTSFRPWSFNLATTAMSYFTNITSTAGGAEYNFTTNPLNMLTQGAGAVNHIAVALVVV